MQNGNGKFEFMRVLIPEKYKELAMLSTVTRTAFCFGTAFMLYLLNGNAIAGKTTLVNISSKGVLSNPISSLNYGDFQAQISATGRYMVFVLPVFNLIKGNNNDAKDIFAHDNLKHTTQRVSVDLYGKQAISTAGTPVK
jgi:hypothetical protein